VSAFPRKLSGGSIGLPTVVSYSTTNSRANRNLPLDTNTTSWNHHHQQQGAQQGRSSNNVGMMAPIVAGSELMGPAAYMMSQHGGLGSTDIDDGGDW
jgi:hypothetical protein